MKELFLWVYKNILWRSKIKPCHHPNLIERKWLDEETPMITQSCVDCGFYDSGHVHADPATWLKENNAKSPSNS